jgi:heme/copper-type cytochrome/quinol oxidase subunit 4
MSEAVWFGIAILLLLAFLYWRTKPGVAANMDSWIYGCLITAMVVIGGLVAVYGFVRFVRWAWYN